MSRRPRLRVPVVGLTALATVAAYAGISVPVREARAADAETTALISLFDGLEALLPGVAAIGDLAKPLPTLSVAPGSSAGIGLETVLSESRTAVLGGADFNGAADVDDFVDAIDGAAGGISAGRTVAFTASKSTVGTVDSVTIGMTATRTVSSTRLDVVDDDPIGPGFPPLSLSSSGGVRLVLELSGSFIVNYDSATSSTWITRTGASPSLSVDATGSIPTPAGVDVGIGILAAELGSDTTYDLETTTTTSWSDPNNDGRLAFDEPGGATGDGELAAAGAGAGLVTAGLANGSLAAALHVVPTTGGLIDLGDVDVTLGVNSADLTTTDPAVTVDAGSLDTVRPFLTLSTRDLAQGLAQAASTVMALQNSMGAGLPFMRGDFSNAVGAVEAITTYLAANVPEPTPASPTPGLPSFTSLQDLLADLDAISGDAAVAVTGALYDAAKRKVSFALDITHAAGSPEDLNPVGTPISGDANYSDTTLVDAGKSFSASLVGRQVVAGTASGVIKTVSGDTLTLDPAPVTSAVNPSPTVYWNGGRPANGTTYSIAAADPKIGAVELGDALKQNANGAIENANAKTAQASVTPSYTLHLPIVLDLRDPDTTDCDPTAAVAACPNSYTANGITSIIDSLPRTADRIMLHTGDISLLTADAPISTEVDIDATVGFLGVKVKGTLKECTTSAGNVDSECVGTPASTDHLLSIQLKSLPDADADGDISFPAFVAKLTDALSDSPPTVSDLVTFDVNGHAYADLTVEVPGAPQFFGGTAPSATVEVSMPDISDPTTFTVSPSTNLADLGTFNLDASNPLALFGAILADLQAVQAVVGDFPGSGALNTQIPLVGKSFNDVIGAGASGGGSGVTYGSPSIATSSLTDTGKTFDESYIGRTLHVGSVEAVIAGLDPSDPTHTLILSPKFANLPDTGAAYSVDSELQGLIDTLQATSSNSLQEMLTTLAEKLGAGSNATFEVIDGTPDQLKIKLHWARGYVNQAPLDFKFELPSGTDRSIIGAQGSGLVTTTASGELNLSLLIPLDVTTFANPATALRIDPTESNVHAGVVIDSGDSLRVTGNLGPFQISLGDPNTSNPAGTQLKAGLGVDLTGTGSGPQTLSAFVSGLALAVDGSGVTCDGLDPGSTTLALCAKLPTYINGTLAGSDANAASFKVMLPVNTTDLADSLNVLGSAINGHARVETPADLLSALSSAALNLLSFGDGFFSYLQFLENGLRTASFDGKLPLIGKDLQAGSDFVGGLRTDLEGVFGSIGDPTATNAGQIREFLREQVKPAMPKVPGGGFHFDVECVAGATLATVGQPDVTANGGGTGTFYKYKVVAYTSVDGAATETVPSDASDPDENGDVASLDATHFNHIAWTAVANATGYRIYRANAASAAAATDFKLIKDVADATTGSKVYDDTGDADGAALNAATTAPCPDSAAPDQVNGFTMSVDIGQGDPSAAEGCKALVTADPDVDASDKACLGGRVPFDLGIPGLSIKSTPTTNSDGIDVGLGWRLHLKVGLNRDDGFFVQTQDTAAPEFQVGAFLDVHELDAQLAFIKVHQSAHGTDKKEFVGAFVIDIKDSATADDCTATCTASDGPGSPRLTLDKLTNASSLTDFVKPLLTANIDLDWHLAAQVDSALPGISTNFRLTWGWTSDAPGDFSSLNVAFNDVKLDAGDFLGKAIKPIIQQVVDVFKPVQPVIDTLFEPVPVLSDLSEAVGGDPITIASLAETFSTLAGGPDLQPFLDVLKNIRDLLKALQGDCSPDPSPCITVGSFSLVTAKAVTQDANPSTAAGLIDSGAPSYDLHGDVLTQVNSRSTKPITETAADTEHMGFSFPFLEHPEKIFGLLVGQDVDLVKFDSGPLTLGFEFQQSFGPVYAPPPVNIVVGGGASVTLRIVAGFDTYGIRTAIERGKLDAKILDSLFFYTTDEATGKPLPVVQFEGYLQAGASISLVVIEVGVVGGVKLTISFYWNDPNNDGKFRFSEFLATALSNPICLFNVGGELSLFIKVFITLGISPFSVSFDFTLVDVVILSFNLKPDCTPPPPKLGGTKDGVLYLFAGKFAGKAQRAPTYSGDYPFDGKAPTPDSDESWVIRQVPAKAAKAAVPDPDGAGPLLAKPAQTAEKAKITVTALGISEDFDDNGGAITTVVLDGGSYDGKLQVTFNGGDKLTPFSKKVVVRTGTGDDVIRTGTGVAVVDAGGGVDQVTTLERTDLAIDPATAPTALVSGGAGADSLTVGNGHDTVLGDKGLVFHDQGTISVTDASGGAVSLPAPLDPNDVDVPSDPGDDAGSGGADQIAAGLGGSTLYGNEGDDKIGTANDNPQAQLAGIPNPSYYRAGANTIVGGRGSDRIKSGSASDTIYTGSQVDIGQDDPGAGDDDANQNSVDTGEGSDTVYGSNAQDFVTTHSTTSQTATAYGGGNEDVLIGGLGTDRLYGGRGDDYLIAGPATVGLTETVSDILTTSAAAGLARTVALDPITPPVSSKTLVGGGGKDRIYGVDGPATIYGDHEVDACARQASPVSKQPAENPVVFPAPTSDRDAADLILGGAGVDTVQAGGGNDHVYLYASDDVACASGGADEVFGGNGADLIYGGSGADNLYGDAQDDELYANTGDDSVYGGLGDDSIQGNEGSDFLTGGLGNDNVVGGTTKAGADDTGDRIYGDEGVDVLIGDNAKPDQPTPGDPAPSYPDDLADTSVTPTAGGADTIFGGDGDDLAYGGLDNDSIYGGGGADYLEGNNATDTIYGEGQADDIIGGSSEEASTGVGRPDANDFLHGGAQDDVIAGDNAQLAKVGADLGSALTRGRGLTSERTITLLDLGLGTAPGRFGGDTINGDSETDVILGERGDDTIHGDGGDDYIEGGQDSDTIDGDAGSDDIVGGEFTPFSGSGAATVGQLDAGDTIRGGDDSDAVLGDNGSLLRDPAATMSDLTKGRGITERAIQLYDLGDTPTADTSGADFIHGNAGVDVVLAQSGTDRVLADGASDYAEGGPDADWIEGGDGSDDLVGGSSAINAGSGAAAQGQPDAADVIWGQGGDDVETGDNAIVTRVAPFNDLTFRIGVGSLIEERRAMQLLDLDNGGILTEPDAIRFGGDQLSGQGDTDVLLGQDGPDKISGGSSDDYAEGQGGSDTIFGDQSLHSAGIDPPAVAWPGTASASYDADGGADGQDDLIGGKSQQGFRDAGDEIHGNGVSDYILGDNGTSVRDIQSGTTTISPTDTVPSGSLADRIYAVRYPATPPAGAAKVRHRDPAQSAPTTRYCTTDQVTCEVTGAFGNDLIYGDGGDDFLYGQDGDDTAYGGSEDDDIFGELGNDRLFGDAGDDSILGDRGGVRDVYQDGTNHFFMSVTQVPKVEFDGFNAGDVIRVTDLLHDVDGDAFVGGSTSAAMPHPGLNEGGDDRIRGGTGHDTIHAGFGDDLANGDSGGDWVFGGDGADVMWGGKGCDESLGTLGNPAACYPGGIFDPAPHDAAGETIPAVTDYLVGGKGGTSVASVTQANASDVLDWRPRGSYTTPGTTCAPGAWPVDLNASGKKSPTTTVDPCSWFEMTDITDASDANNQHHQGVDWQYGGWDRDILQGDVADNGPNEGDRLLDWNGTYNLYTHCNSAYGGFNDVRQHSPTWQDFLQRWVWAQGAGQSQSDATTAGTSAFVELALVYPGADNAHGSGSAYPSTPGHFDDPNACAP